MVRVHGDTSDRATAWRIRDALAAHPLLGGGAAQIRIIATREGIVLEGWTLDEDVRQLAVRMAHRAAGRRAVQLRLHVTRCRPVEA
jgi:hypothetical protein